MRLRVSYIHIRRDGRLLCKAPLNPRWGSKPKYLSFSTVVKMIEMPTMCPGCTTKFYTIINNFKNPIVISE